MKNQSVENCKLINLKPTKNILLNFFLLVFFTFNSHSTFARNSVVVVNDNLKVSKNRLIDDNKPGQILVKVIETAGTNIVKYVGWSKGEDYVKGNSKSKNKLLVKKSIDGYFRLDSFITKKSEIKQIDFLLLYDAKKKQIGHISYEYNPTKEASYIRQVIVFLHNNKFECYDALNRKHYPYSNENPFHNGLFGGKWTYFSKGEYSVTMLIPPDYKKANSKQWEGNKFPTKFDKQPVLFIHGLTGKYNDYSKAEVENNETSYWWMQVKHMNAYPEYDAWQVYYPYDTNIEFIARWVKYDIEYLKQLYSKELNLITHSMGGLVAAELITSKYFKAKENIKKVFFIEPPLHGSLGGNKQYRTGRGLFFELFGFDREAPSIRDLSFGSDFYYNLHRRKWPSLDDDKYLSDNYFVLIGTTQEKYRLPKYVHCEAENQTDGIVAMSSASLMDHHIRWATFNGNHDDGRGCWSKLEFNQQNNFLAKLSKAFFSKDLKGFEYELATNKMIDAYVSYYTGKIKVKKRRENVNLKQGIFTIRLKKNGNQNLNDIIKKWDELAVLKSKTKNILVLSPCNSHAKKEEKFIENNSLEDIALLYPDIKGYMSRNPNTSDDYFSYYYTKKPAQVEDCVSDLPEGTYQVVLYFPEQKFTLKLGSFKFKHLQTALVEFNLNNHHPPFVDMENSTAFTNYLPATGVKTDSTYVPDTTVNISDKTERVIFQLVCAEATQKNLLPNFVIKNPAGFVISPKKIETVQWKYDKLGAHQYYVIENPTAGNWTIAAKKNFKSYKKIFYTIRIHEEYSKNKKRKIGLF